MWMKQWVACWRAIWRPEVLDLVSLGMNHEQQHQELILTDVKNGLALNPLRPAYREVNNAGPGSTNIAPALRWHSFPEGVYPIGFEGEGFAFDNEGPRHNVYLAPFRLASRLVTNGEYMEFMRDGGYDNAALWLSDGWDCVRANQWSAPLYWEMRDGQWWHYTLDGMRPVSAEEPVCHVSFYEADAFARWAGERLATEFEWEVASQSCAVEGNFMDSEALHPQVARESKRIDPDVWRCMGVDWQRLSSVSRISDGGWRSRRVQRQVHVQPDGAARRLVCDPAIAHPAHLSQLLSCPMRAGSSWESGWPMATSKQLQFLANDATASAVREGLSATPKVASSEAVLRRRPAPPCSSRSRNCRSTT